MYSNELEEDVAGDTSGHFKRLLIGLLQANRDESKEFDRNKAKQDAQAIYEAGEKKWGTDESRFNVLLVSRSYAQLRATFQEYAKLANKDIEDTLKSEMSGDLLQGMLAIGKSQSHSTADSLNKIALLKAPHRHQTSYIPVINHLEDMLVLQNAVTSKLFDKSV